MLGLRARPLPDRVRPPGGRRARRDVVGDLERFRGMGPRDILARALLLGGYSFGPSTCPALPRRRRRPGPGRPGARAGHARRCSAARRRSGWPPSSRPAAGCCCTACCPCSTTTAPTARCSRTRSGWPPAPASRARRTTSRRCAPRMGGRPARGAGGRAAAPGGDRLDAGRGVGGRRRRRVDRSPRTSRGRGWPGGGRRLRLPVPPRLLARPAGAARRTPAGRDRRRHPRAWSTTTTADDAGQRLLHLVNVAPVAQRFRVPPRRRPGARRPRARARRHATG